jgi:predicted ATPase
MHLQRIKIGSFKNLKDIEIAFSEFFEPSAVDKAAKPIRSHAVIGQNGTGKSNLIEAIITIFRDVDLNNDAGFDYELDYKIRGHAITLKADRAVGNRPVVTINGKTSSQSHLSEHAKEYLPSHVFAYYSGKNERLEALFQSHQERFKNLLKRDGDDLVRRLFYCRGGHSQLVLLACLLSDDPVFAQLLENLNIQALESALFVLKQPHTLRDLKEKDILEGDSRFWYARGTVVTDLLDKLWQVSWAPIEETKDVQIDFRRRPEKQKRMYLFVPNRQKLNELGAMVGTPDRFFRYAEGAYIGDLLEEVRITIKKREENAGNVSFTQLSEGELQMLTVLGLMRITHEDHCLFLLDEPDTHLNPIWKLRYFDDINRMIEPREGATLQGESQIIVTTHDPIMVGSLKREQVRILRKVGDKSEVDTPIEHPQGMGVAGLLKSDMFGLSSTLDHQTLRDLELRNELIAKDALGGLDAGEAAQLERLRHHLNELGFSREYRDPMYQLFIQKMYEVRSQPLGKLLTPEQLKEQEELATRIVKELISRERTDDLSELAKELKLRLGN